MTYVYVVKKQSSFDQNEIKSILERNGAVLLELASALKYSHKGTLYSVDSTKLLPQTDDVCLSYGCDIFVMDNIPHLKEKGELILDMDMTSVQIEGIDELARCLGVYDKVALITATAMHGGLDFASSLKKRVAMLKGGNAAKAIAKVKTVMKETPGLEVLMNTVKSFGWVTGICSGGFEQLICVLDEKYGLDLVKANSLEIKDGIFTGNVDKAIVDASDKKEGVLELMEKSGVRPSQVIVLGDGANDLKMMEAAALGIAYHAKPLVREKAKFKLDHSDLSAVALLLEMYAGI